MDLPLMDDLCKIDLSGVTQYGGERMSLKKRITFLISLMLILMIIVSINAIYHQSSKILNEEAESRMTAQLDRANENVSLLLKSIVLETEKLSLDSMVKGYFLENVSQVDSDLFLMELMDKKNMDRPVYMDLFLVDHDGMIVSAAMPEAVGIDVNGRNYFQTAVFRQVTNTSDIILSRADQTQIVITLTPTHDEEGEVIGYTGIAIFATYFSDFLKGFAFNDESQYIIVDSYDKIVSHPNNNMISKEFDNFGLPHLKDTGSKQSYLVAKLEGIKHIVMERELDFNNWRIISYLESDLIYSKSRDVAYTVLQIGIAFVLIAIIMGIYLTDMVSKPIVDITERINRIIEEEAVYKNTMINKLPLEHLEQSKVSLEGQEPTEISNFRKAIEGFRNILEQGSRNFDLEHNKLKGYIDNLYDELDNINSRNLEFISTLSHDIRTPLTLIKGYARGLESGTVHDPDMEEKFKSGIVKSANDIEHLIYNVLDFAYSVGNRDSLNMKSYSLAEVVDQLVFEIDQLYSESDRDLTFEIDDFEGVNDHVLLDMMNINRVVVNLINNSIKYSSTSDTIALRIRRTENGAKFEVFDTGIGIKKEELDKITDIFYRTEASKDKKGYGLGLYICDQILKGHGYSLLVDSVKDEYTSAGFEITGG